jgi:hypothetical protein
VSQLAAVNSDDFPALKDIGDPLYIHASGGCQQLKGPTRVTKRTKKRFSKSEPIKAVWVDGIYRTGSSLKAGIEMLKTKYNIEVTHALYLVDCSQDAQIRSLEDQCLADPVYDNVDIKALYDFKQVYEVWRSMRGND